MPFANYSSANVARAELDAGILASATAILLKSGQGDLFPSTFPFFAVLEAYEAGAVTKREIVRVTGKTDDTLAVVRSAGYCPASDTATAQTNTAFAFSSGDSFTHILTAEQQKDVQDEVARLETDKLDKDGALRTGLTAKRVLITSATGEETYLSGTSGQVVGFDPDGDPVAVTPTVDIDSLTHKPSPSFIADPLIVFSDADNSNRKVFLDDIRASNAEAVAGTENAKFVTPLSLASALAPISIETKAQTLDMGCTISAGSINGASLSTGWIVTASWSGSVLSGGAQIYLSWSDNGTTWTTTTLRDYQSNGAYSESGRSFFFSKWRHFRFSASAANANCSATISAVAHKFETD